LLDVEEGALRKIRGLRIERVYEDAIGGGVKALCLRLRGMSKLRILEEKRKKPKRISFEEKEKLLTIVRSILEKEDRIGIAVIHGGFLDSEVFRDIDVAVYMDQKLDYDGELVYIEELRDKLEKATKISMDIQLLNEAPPSFVYHVLSEGNIIVEKKVGVSSILRMRSLEEMKRLRKGLRE